MSKKIDFKRVLISIQNDLNEFDKKGILKGMEALLQKAVHKSIPGSRREVDLKEMGAVAVNDGIRGKIDIVSDTHGIELKVIEFPRIKNVTLPLYDIGQISGDYWRLKNAGMLKSFEIIILLHGDLVKILKTPKQIHREFHNRMFVDYSTAMEAKDSKGFTNVNSKYLQTRKRQLKIIKELEFNIPFSGNIPKTIETITTVVEGDYALLSIKVLK